MKNRLQSKKKKRKKNIGMRYSNQLKQKERREATAQDNI